MIIGSPLSVEISVAPTPVVKRSRSGRSNESSRFGWGSKEQMNKMVTASMENNLQNFTLDGKAEQSLFEFEGTDFGKKKGSTFITLPKRERKKQTYRVYA